MTPCTACNLADETVRDFPCRKWLPGGETVQLWNRDGSKAVRPFHPDCHIIWWREHVAALTELEQPLNDSAYFVRDGKTMAGWYERDGQRYPEKLDARLSLLDLPARIEDGQRHRPFMEWLDARGWWPNWWKHRRSA